MCHAKAAETRSVALVPPTDAGGQSCWSGCTVQHYGSRVSVEVAID